MSRRVLHAYDGACYIESIGLAPSELGRAVADILAYVYEGLHHLDGGVLRRASWSNERSIEVRIPGSMATFDDDRLTRLVVLAHETCVRVEIRGCSSSSLRVWFSQRRADAGLSSLEYHPDMDEGITRLRRTYAKLGGS